MMATYRKIFHANNALAYFMHNEFPIVTKKCEGLHYLIEPSERPDFGIDIEDEKSCFFFVSDHQSLSAFS